jgi:plasmid stabilization system protein ParE
VRGFAFHPLAGRDLDGAFEYYEGERYDLGNKFIRAVYALLGRLVAYPESGPSLTSSVRVARVDGFPYDVFYKIEVDRDRIFVIQISHQHRKPGLWRKRL